MREQASSDRLPNPAERAHALGFACNWDPNPAGTWSGTPWHLLGALRSHADVRDVGTHLGSVTRVFLKGVHIRRVSGRWVSPWKHGQLTHRLLEHAIRSRIRACEVDAVIQMGDLCDPGVPFYVVEDLSYQVLLDHFRDGDGVPHFPGLSRQQLERLRDRQRKLHERATGLIALSAWLAESLVASGVPRSKVHVMYPGAIALASPSSDRPTRSAPRRRLLFVGKDFVTKGGDLVVSALQRIRREAPDVRLTVAGPATWPLADAPPEGVDFLGRVPVARVAQLMDSHDLLLMPSRIEGFGIVFVEALARGLPCIGRDAFAMPELIKPGFNGDLVRKDDPAELAAAVLRVLGDETLYERAARDARSVAKYFTWDRAAMDLLAVVAGRPAPPRWSPGLGEAAANSRAGVRE